MGIPVHMAQVAGRLRTGIKGKGGRPVNSFVFSNRSKASTFFGVDNLLYARRVRTGKWLYAEDVGVWYPVDTNPSMHQADELEHAYQAWLTRASAAELNYARLTRTGKDRYASLRRT